MPFANSVLLLLCAFVSLSTGGGSRLEAVRLVDSAARLLARVGPESAFVAINDTSGAFVDRELYVFAYDFEGTIRAHARSPVLVGKSMLETPDVDGKPFRREILRVAKTNGSGWVEYRYRNPLTDRIERKSTWIRRSGRFVLCCGVYLP